ncbi:MAG: long-chain fatty acid--CoA ligase [Chlorobiaceae bacterium]|nr:long-chain fatty acid--CoA ligase [Chlorobiaceae bacterium]
MTERPWFNHYDAGVPQTLQPYPEHTLLDVLRETVKSGRGDDPALLFQGTTISYRELEEQSGAFASALVAAGVRKGERVAIVMPNSPQMIIAEFGIWKAGGVVVPINPLYTGHELEYAISECGAETAVVLSLFYAKVCEVRGKTPLKRIVASNIKDYLPPLKRLLFTMLKEAKEGHRASIAPGDYGMREMIAAHEGKSPTGISVTHADPAVFMFSGGTTGRPKCAIGRHQALVISGMQISKWFGVVLSTREDSIILNMPLFHVYGQLGIMTAGLVRNYPLILVPNPKDIDGLLKLIKSQKPAVLPGVPTLFNALAAHPKLQKDHTLLKSIKLIVSGASPLHLETRQRFESMTGAQIIEAYGMTESMLAAVFTPVLGIKKNGAVGVPGPDVDIRIVDADDSGVELPSGAVGEVLMQAPQLMECYWHNPSETEGMLRGGWLHTGDLGYLDEDGFLFIVDRKKDLIKPSGFQVWPREVEEVIALHPSVLEVGVAGVPDDRKGEAVKAWVVLRNGCELPVEELKEHCRKELAAYKVPNHIEFREALPKSHIGKVLRRQLVEEHNSLAKSGT